uniref:Uncharacterized protein n=1 Tax=Arundo donax TaxID=35708 RepID=A0A0A8YA99_ARUDO
MDKSAWKLAIHVTEP